MRMSEHHQKLTDGVGKCSVPMWCQGMPAGFCDEPAYGPQDTTQRERGGGYGPGWEGGRWYPGGVWTPSYCPGLACYAHGGPAKPDAPKVEEKASEDVADWMRREKEHARIDEGRDIINEYRSERGGR